MQSVNQFDTVSQLIFAPDPLSRFQYEKVHGKKASQADDQALRALMLALLEDAIACYQGRFLKPSRSNDKLFQETEEWIRSQEDSVFSFNNVCETLGLHPEKLREGLERWKARQVKVPVEGRKRLIASKGKGSARSRYLRQPSSRNAARGRHCNRAGCG